MNQQTDIPELHPFSLYDIASWQGDLPCGHPSEWKAGIPSLQRGLVWSPQQIEMLWDSLFRGFPVGSLVLCPRIDAQVKKSEEPPSHHLLDGQQRCDAIALGWREPFSLAGHEPPKDGKMFWIDLNPDLNAYTTRAFLFRVTDSAHPWGYLQDDTARPLPAWQVRDALAQISLDPTEANYRRPAPHMLAPYQAKCPVPLAWLLEAISREKTHRAVVEHLVERLSFRSTPKWIQSVQDQLPWPGRAKAFLEDTSEEAFAQREKIFAGACRAISSRIPGMIVSRETSMANRLESGGRENEADISNVDQLFQRLNRQGTRLDGEELAYSMIKAHWPELADPIEALHIRRMPPARLVVLAARAALTISDPEKQALHGPINVSRIRRIAVDRGEEASAIFDFVENHLGEACEFLERVLRYDPVQNPKGLLPVHLASIAHHSPDLYLLLLILSFRLSEKGAVSLEKADTSAAFLRLALRVHWFSFGSKEASNFIFTQLMKADLNPERIGTALHKAVEARYLMDLPSPVHVGAFISMPAAEHLQDWSWWQCIEVQRKKAHEEEVSANWEAFIYALINNREMLLYAQRAYLAQRFPDYDPSRRDYWSGHNRPWDFDHIFAAIFIHNVKRIDKPNHAFLKQWKDTIGNLRAWPFEDNRSDHADPASAKLQTKEQMDSSYLRSEEIDAFSSGYEALTDEVAARDFAETAMRRMLRMYEECLQVL